jgi:hypothetical protein
MTRKSAPSQQADLDFAKPQPNDGPVECLGMTFESDDARRAHFLGLLREKLRDPEFRKIPGFPTGSDDAILRMSDPPYYTACPNPFLEDFARAYGKPCDPSEHYEREPFAVEVSVGKTDGNVPCTVGELKERLDGLVSEISKGKDITRVRVVVE